MKGKKLLIVFVVICLALVAILSGAGCAKPAPTPSPKPIPAPTPSPKPITAPTPEPARVKELKLAHCTSTRSVYQAQYEAFKKEIEQKTNGQVRITILSGAPFGTEKEQHAMIKAGTLDIGTITLKDFPGKYLLCGTLELPFISDDVKVHYLTAQELLKRGLLDKVWYEEVHPLAVGGPDVYHMMTVKKKVRTIQDMKGLSMKQTTGTQTPVFESLGAISVPLPYVETYNGVQRGIVGGLLFSYPSVTDTRIDEFIKYACELNMTGPIIAFEMNKKLYESLSKETQKIFDEAAEHSVMALVNECLAQRDTAKAVLIKRGAEIYMPTPTEKQEWINAFTPVWDSWLKDTDSKGIPAREFLHEYGETVKKLGGKWPHKY